MGEEVSNDFKRNDPGHDGGNDGSHSTEQQDTGDSRSGASRDEALLHDAQGLSRAAAQKLEEQESEQVVSVGVIATRSWSGMLPPPEDFNSYSPETQTKLIEWTDRRHDQVDQSIRQMRLQVTSSVWLVVFSLVIAFIVALKTKDPLLVGLFLAPQLFGYLSKMIKN